MYKNYKECQVEKIINLEKSISNTLNLIIFFKYKFKTIYPRQDTIAKALNISRKSVNKALAVLADLGLITKKYRHMTSCVYNISNIFFNREFWLKARKYLPALNALLFVMVTQLNSKEIRNKDYRYIHAQKLDKNPILKELVMINDREFIIKRCLENKIPAIGLYPEIINVVGEKLKLSFFAKTKLLGFNPEIISKAYSYYRQREQNPQFNIKSPYSLLFNLCYSTANGLKQKYDRKLVAQLLDHFNFKYTDALYTQAPNKVYSQKSQKREISKPIGSFLRSTRNNQNEEMNQTKRYSSFSCFEKYIGNTEINKYKEEMLSAAKTHVDKISDYQTPTKLGFAAELDAFRKKVINNNIKYGKII